MLSAEENSDLRWLVCTHCATHRQMQSLHACKLQHLHAYIKLPNGATCISA